MCVCVWICTQINKFNLHKSRNARPVLTKKMPRGERGGGRKQGAEVELGGIAHIIGHEDI